MYSQPQKKASLLITETAEQETQAMSINTNRDQKNGFQQNSRIQKYIGDYQDSRHPSKFNQEQDLKNKKCRAENQVKKKL